MNKQDNTSNGKGHINVSTLEELRQLARFSPVRNKKPYIKQWQGLASLSCIFLGGC